MISEVKAFTGNITHSTDITCPNCAAIWPEQVLADSDYLCGRCGLKLAYVDTSLLGTPRNIQGWLRQPDELILGRYRVKKVLGQGGFGVTYLVEDQRLKGRVHALKEIPEALYDETELELLNGLRHPSIPEITDHAKTDGMIYLVLKFAGDRTLENERIRRGGRIPLVVLRPWLLQLGEVLNYLHRQHPPIIHRDLKPENVMLDERDRIVLIDFGIAKQCSDNNKTRAQAQAATQGYSPPEQSMGGVTDPRTDIYALAATTYALLTGKVPTRAANRVAGDELTPPVQLLPELPSALNDAVLRGLNLNKNLRPMGIDDFLRPFAQWIPDDPPLALSSSETVKVERLSEGLDRMSAQVRIGTIHTTVSATTGATTGKRQPSVTAVAAGVLAVAAATGGFWYYSMQSAQLDPLKPVSMQRKSEEPGTAQAAVTKPAISLGAPDAKGLTLSGEPGARQVTAMTRPATNTGSGDAKRPPVYVVESAAATVEEQTRSDSIAPIIDTGPNLTAPKPRMLQPGLQQRRSIFAAPSNPFASGTGNR